MLAFKVEQSNVLELLRQKGKDTIPFLRSFSSGELTIWPGPPTRMTRPPTPMWETLRGFSNDWLFAMVEILGRRSTYMNQSQTQISTAICKEVQQIHR